MAAENAYDYAYGFEPAYAPETSPVTQPEQEQKPELKKVKKRKIDIQRQNERATNVKLFKITANICSFLALYALVCSSFAARTEAKQALDAEKEKYIFCEAENRELKVQLNSIVSAENIDRIAVEKLGLVKVAAGDEIYLDTNSGNKVIYRQGK